MAFTPAGSAQSMGQSKGMGKEGAVSVGLCIKMKDIPNTALDFAR
jgi:hypothetical protein